MPDAALAAHIRALGDVPQQPDTYRGWSVYRGRWPEPAYMATGPNYEASYEGEEDGWVGNGENADGKTWDAVCAEIDAWYEENPCEHCDGEGRVWKHADPTTGQSVECEICNQFEAPGHPALAGPTRSTPGVVGPQETEGNPNG